MAFSDELIDPGFPHGHDRELGSDEEAVRKHEQQHGRQPPHDICP
jgi:hypothetical protein